MKLRSEPSGALVFLNGEEVGRTPTEVPFTWYGHYDVELRKEGFATLRTERWVAAPWWQWVPLDLVAALMPVRLRHEPVLAFRLTDEADASAGLVERAEASGETLETP